MERSFTFETRLPRLDYFEEFVRHYNHLMRVAWHDAVNGVDIRSSAYRKNMRAEYGILTATENAITSMVRGKLQACLALEERRREEKEHRLEILEARVSKLTSEINHLKPDVQINTIDCIALQKYRNLKRHRYKLQSEMNGISQLLSNPIKPKITFGSKAFLNKGYHLQENGFKNHESWWNAYVRKRDSNFYYIGEASVTYGNRMIKLIYNESSDTFDLQITKEKQYHESNKDKHIFLTGLTFKSKNRSFLINALKRSEQGYQPMSYRILRRGKKWYLQAMFTAMFDVNKNTSNGAIGIDFNNGFLSVVETDRHGNIAKVHERITLEYHGMGNRAKNEMLNIIKCLIFYAYWAGKPIVIEGLDFSDKKCEAISKHGRKYNQMLHRLDYARFREWIVNTGMLYGVGVLIVSPAYTSYIAEHKYCYQRKLNKHDGAAYVIARRGQEYHDYVA